MNICDTQNTLIKIKAEMIDEIRSKPEKNVFFLKKAVNLVEEVSSLIDDYASSKEEPFDEKKKEELFKFIDEIEKAM